MLTLVHGPFHPHLERAFADELRRLKSDDPLAPVAVVAPSRSLLARLRGVALEAFPRGVANVRFLTLTGFAHAVLAGAGDDVPAHLDEPLVYRAAIARTVREVLAQSPRLGPLRDFPGLLDLLFASVRDLQDALVDPVQGVRAIEEGMFPEADAELLAELFLLQLRYREVLERERLTDGAGLLGGAGARLGASRWVAGLRGVLCYGFYDVTGAQDALLEAMERAVDLVFFLPYDADDPAFAFARGLHDRLLGRARWIKDVRGPAPPPPAIALAHASGRADEVWHVAKEVLRLVDEERVPPRDIAVVARSLDGGHGEALVEAFAGNGLPHATGWRAPLFSHPLARAVAQVIGLEEEGYGRRAVIELVSGPFFRAGEGGAGRPDQWDLLSRALAIRGGREQWRERLARVAGKDVSLAREEREEEDAPRVPADEVARLAERVARLFDALAPLPETGRWCALADGWREALERLFDPGEDPGDLAAWEAILGELERLRACDLAGGEVERAFFAATFLRALEGARIGAAPGPDADGVRVLDAMEARGLSFPVVFVVGLNEPGFPRAIDEEPFLRDALRRRLDEVPGGSLPEKLRGFDEERLLFRLLEQGATRELRLSWQRSDEKGRALVPSVYLRPWLEKAEQGKLARTAVPLGIRNRLRTAPWDRLTPCEAALRLALDGRGAAGCLAACGREVADYEHAIAALREIDRFGPMAAHDGLVGDLGEFWERLARRGLSPTALETYGKCPFQFFARHVLSLEPLVEPESVSQLAAAEQGTLVHLVLERTVRAIRDAEGYARPGTVDARAVVRGEAARAFAEFEAAHPVGYPLLWEARKRALMRRLEDYAAFDLERAARDGFLPLHVEDRGRADIDLNGEVVRFLGRMDRLETRVAGGEIAFRVRDYKTGRVPSELRSGKVETQIVRGKRLQLPIYLEVGRSFLDEEQARGRLPAGTLHAEAAVYEYLGLDVDEPVTFEVGGNFWDSNEGVATRVTLRRFADGIRAGRFFIHPSSDTWGHCSWCDFSTLCRKEHIPTARRAEEDESTREYRTTVGK